MGKEYLIVKELAKGVQMIVNNAALRVIIVSEEIAQKFLSKTAIKHGDKEQDGNLAYPESDGRASIPMLELGSKGYVWR